MENLIIVLVLVALVALLINQVFLWKSHKRLEKQRSEADERADVIAGLFPGPKRR